MGGRTTYEMAPAPMEQMGRRRHQGVVLHQPDTAQALRGLQHGAAAGGVLTPEEVDRIRADERARILYLLQRRWRIMVHVRETQYPDDNSDRRQFSEQGSLDLIGWLASEIQMIEEADWAKRGYDLVAPPNDEEPRALERNIWKVEWR